MIEIYLSDENNSTYRAYKACLGDEEDRRAYFNVLVHDYERICHIQEGTLSSDINHLLDDQHFAMNRVMKEFENEALKIISGYEEAESDE